MGQGHQYADLKRTKNQSDMRILFIILLLIASSFKERTSCLKLDILLVVDLSGSIVGHQKFIAQALTDFTDNLELSEEGINIGLIEFSNQATLVSHLSGNKEQIRAGIGSLPYPGGGTNMTDAFMLSLNEFVRYGRPGYSRIIVMISDGVPDNGDTALEVSKQLKAIGTMIFCVSVEHEVQSVFPGMSYETDADMLKSIASPGCFVSTNYESLVVELKKLDICL